MEQRNSFKRNTALHAITLYQQCVSDNRAMQERAFQELGEFLLRIALSRLRGKPHLTDLAQECTQQSLAVIWQKLRQGNGPDHPEFFMTWSASIVIHKLIDQLRKLDRYAVESADSDWAENEPWLLNLPDQKSLSPNSYSIEKELREELVAIVESHPRLSDDAKVVVLHGFLLEQDDEDLAQDLGKARATIRVLRSRGLSVLRSDPEVMIRLRTLQASLA
jgi:RNA polymerase sigma factor (sigma-70 family)